MFLHDLPGAIVLQMHYKFCTKNYAQIQIAIQIDRVCRVLPTLANHKTGQHTGQRQAFPYVDALVTAAYKPFGFGTTFPTIP